jgi:cytochrome P450 family 110
MSEHDPANINDTFQGLPPGPTSSAWEQARAWIERPVEFWTECQKAFGNTFTIQFGSLGSTVLFCEPDAIHEIFALPGDRFECKEFNDHYRVIMGSKSLLTLDGDEHWKQRRLLSPSFQAASIPEWVCTVRHQMQQQIQALQNAQVIHVRRLIHEVSLGIILNLLFRNEQPGIRKFLHRLFLDYIVSDYGTWSPWARFANAHGALRALIGTEIRRRRAESAGHTRSKKDSLFERLLQYDELEAPTSETQIEDHVFTMLIAGVDPSAIATTWAIYWIYQHPHVQARLHEELKCGDVDKYVEDESTYLHQVCLESLRMFPVVTTPSGRKLLKASEIGGRLYPAGITLLPCTYLAHRREDVFPCPDEFRPERFAGRTYKNSEYFPFGGGRRTCIGSRIAPITMKAIIAELIRNSELHSVSHEAVTPIRHGTLLAPSDNFRLQVVAATGPSAY